jgi:hypothetical protein
MKALQGHEEGSTRYHICTVAVQHLWALRATVCMPQHWTSIGGVKQLLADSVCTQSAAPTGSKVD